jgi:type IV pilus assembly protein PilE
MKHGKRTKGFTLVELMVTVAVVAILASIALPAYSNFTKQANRTDATKTMQLAAQSLERCYSQRFTYLNCNVSGTAVVNGSTVTTPNAFYRITFAIPDAQDYTLTAVPIAAPQTGDTQCVQFTLAGTGTQAAQDNHAGNSTRACWGSN